MQKIIILGAGGTLGQELVKKYKQSGCKVFGLKKNELDINQESSIKELMSSIQPDLIINASAMNAVDKVEIDDAEYQKALTVNGTSVGTLAKISASREIPFVHYSTDFVFDGGNVNGYTEDAVPNPISRYGETKLLGEEEIKKNSDKFYIIRVSRLFGEKGSSENTKSSFVDLMLKLACVDGKRELRMVNDQFTCPTYVADVTESTFDLVANGNSFGMYHAANIGSCSSYEFASVIFEKIGIPMKLIPVSSSEFEQPARRPQYSELINTKLPKMRHWQDALEEYLQTIQALGK